MSLERFEHARTLLEGALEGPEALDPGLQHRLCHAAARLEALADPTEGLAVERERWLTEADEDLQAADAATDHPAITNTIRDARQLLKDPESVERATSVHANGSTHLDDRAISKWTGPVVLLAALTILCAFGVALAHGGVPA
jgi:hypothetical protein